MSTNNKKHCIAIKKIKGKKAVSPLIATVLLIAFAVALGAVVMNWGSGYVQAQAKSTGEKSDADVKCTMDAYLNIIDIGGTTQLCYNNETSNERIEFTIENGPTIAVESLLVTIISNVSNVIGGELNETFAKGEVKRLNVSYSKDTNGEPVQIRIVPKIKIPGVLTPVACSKNPLKKEEFPVCT